MDFDDCKLEKEAEYYHLDRKPSKSADKRGARYSILHSSRMFYKYSIYNSFSASFMSSSTELAPESILFKVFSAAFLSNPRETKAFNASNLFVLFAPPIFSASDSNAKTLPFKFRKILPEEKYLQREKNPPKVKILFHENIKNLKLINCYSNEGGKWRQSKITFVSANFLEVLINEKFIGERGRINCSLRDSSGFWRWLGIQFVISDKS